MSVFGLPWQSFLEVVVCKGVKLRGGGSHGGIVRCINWSLYPTVVDVTLVKPWQVSKSSSFTHIFFLTSFSPFDHKTNTIIPHSNSCP